MGVCGIHKEISSLRIELCLWLTTARPIAKLKPPLCSAESKLPIGVKIPFSTKYGEWVIYAEPVTNTIYPLLQCQKSSGSAGKSTDQTSEDPGLNPG